MNHLFPYDPTPTVIFDTQEDVVDKLSYILIFASYFRKTLCICYGIALTTRDLDNYAEGYQRISVVTVPFRTKTELEVFVKESKNQHVRIA
jgi:hypothetical protein